MERHRETERYREEEIERYREEFERRSKRVFQKEPEEPMRGQQDQQEVQSQSREMIFDKRRPSTRKVSSSYSDDL